MKARARSHVSCLATLLCATANAYPDATHLTCDKPLEVGSSTTLMGSIQESSSSRSVQIRLKSTNDLQANNAYYITGAEYTVSISNTDGYYAIEVDGADDFAGLTASSCGSTNGYSYSRVNNHDLPSEANGRTVVAPGGGVNLKFTIAWAVGYSTVYVRSKTMLAPIPSPVPVPAPTTLLRPSPLPIPAPTPAPVVAPGNPTRIPVPAPSSVPVSLPSSVPVPAPIQAPTPLPTAAAETLSNDDRGGER